MLRIINRSVHPERWSARPLAANLSEVRSGGGAIVGFILLVYLQMSRITKILLLTTSKMYHPWPLMRLQIRPHLVVLILRIFAIIVCFGEIINPTFH